MYAVVNQVLSRTSFWLLCTLGVTWSPLLNKKLRKCSDFSVRSLTPALGFF